MPKSAWPTNPMQIGLWIPGKIKINNHIHTRNINAPRTKIRTDQTPAPAQPEIMEHFVARKLVHFGVDEVARVVQFGYLFGEKFDAESGVAEYYCLLHVQFGEEEV